MSALRFRLTNFLLALVLLTLIAIVAMLATDARGGPLDPGTPPQSTDSVRLPGTPVSASMVIFTPGHYYLTRDIAVTGADTGFIIAASGVSLDLGGFSIQGDDSAGSYGIRFDSFEDPVDVRIYNGMIRDFNIAIDTTSGERILIDGVHAASNVRAFQLEGQSVLQNCTAIRNTETGIYVPGDNSFVQDCTSALNTLDGIAVAGNSNVVERNLVWNNGGDDVKDVGPGIVNVFRGNSTGNIVLRNGGMARVVDNQCLTAIATPTGNFLAHNAFC